MMPMRFGSTTPIWMTRSASASWVIPGAASIPRIWPPTPRITVDADALRVNHPHLDDAKRIGIMGHSWGGFDTTYLATHTANFFAAAVAGAPITDLVSNYGNHHWSSGIAETDHIETGQQRMEVPLYEDLQAYIRNSAVFGVAGMTP